MPWLAENLVGRTFGNWTIVDRVENNASNNACFLARCTCGNESIVRGTVLRAGKSIKCRPCNITKHGQTAGDGPTPEYRVCGEMVQRCHNSNNAGFANYGGRGIEVCDEWRTSFKSFFDFIGPRPTPKHSIDRYPDNDGNYEPGNVRWATAKEQAANKHRKTQHA